MSSIGERWDESNPHLELKAPQCHSCEHYIVGTVRCVAFPDGIPDPIISGDVDHKDPYPTDNGIMFKLKVAR